MSLSKNEVLKRDASRNIGEELLQAIRDVKAGNIGDQYEVEQNEIDTTVNLIKTDKKDFVHSSLTQRSSQAR